MEQAATGSDPTKLPTKMPNCRERGSETSEPQQDFVQQAHVLCCCCCVFLVTPLQPRIKRALGQVLLNRALLVQPLERHPQRPLQGMGGSHGKAFRSIDVADVAAELLH